LGEEEMKAGIISAILVTALVSGAAAFRHQRMLSSDYRLKAQIAFDSVGRLGTPVENDIRWLDAQKAVDDSGYAVSTVPDQRLQKDLQQYQQSVVDFYKEDIEQDATAARLAQSGSIEEAQANLKWFKDNTPMMLARLHRLENRRDACKRMSGALLGRNQQQPGDEALCFEPAFKQ
jgi:hypothetical protein